jgi:acyl-CoA reductase-like NAD-dependent aldehyde dehydrogenase
VIFSRCSASGGVDNGARRPVTPMCMSRWRMPLWRRRSGRSSPSTGRTRNQTQIIHAIISPRKVSRPAGLIDPSKVLIGGESDPGTRYLAPTILYPVTWDDPPMKDEIFGPTLPILTYQSLDEAFGNIIAHPHPLAAFIFQPRSEENRLAKLGVNSASRRSCAEKLADKIDFPRSINSQAE